MIELPEALVISAQADRALTGRVIRQALPPSSPHRLAWFTGDSADYPARLQGRAVTGARSRGGLVEIALEGGLFLWLCDGANPRLHGPGAPRPAKYQLMAELDDGSAVTVTVAMYGGILLGEADQRKDMYLRTSFTDPSPLTDDFTRDYFDSLFTRMDENAGKLTAKAFLATHQRIPGLGNGVLQDLLWRARIHPKRKIATLSDMEKSALYDSVRGTLRTMADLGGRDTENDLYGQPGGYGTVMSKTNTAMVCPSCGGGIRRESFMGGNITFCPACQPLDR